MKHYTDGKHTRLLDYDITLDNIYEASEDLRIKLEDIGIFLPFYTIHVNGRLKAVWGKSIAMCTPDGTPHSFKIELSKQLFSYGQIKIQETLIHEMLHLYDIGDGHGKVWKSLCDKVLDAYGIEIYTWMSVEEAKKLAAAENITVPTSVERKSYKIVCPSCKTSWTRYRKCDLTKTPELYTCSACKHRGLKLEK